MGTTYAEIIELDSYWSGFVDEFYGIGSFATTSALSDMTDAFDGINELLRGVETIATVPVGTQRGGKYPKSLRELQCREVLFRRAVAGRNIDLSGNIPQHIQIHFDISQQIKEDIIQGNRIFEDQVSINQIGLHAPSITTQTGKATFYNSFDITELPYLGDDYPRNFRIRIDGTSGGNDIGKSTFKFSIDNGYSYPFSNNYTATTWIHLTDNVHIRWEPGTTGNQLELGDEWFFRAIPDNVKSVFGKDSIGFYKVRRG